MSDLKGTPGGEAGQTNRLYHDEGDGTHSESFAAHLRGWDTTDLAWYRLPVDHSTGALKVNVSGAGSGGTSSNDGDAYTAYSSAGTAAMVARDDTSPASLAENTVGIARSTQWRAMHVNLRDANGNEVSVGGGTQYTEGDTDASITGNAILWEDASNTLATVSASKPLPTSLVHGIALSGTLPVSLVSGAAIVGTVSLGGPVNVTQGTSPWLVSLGTHAVTQSGGPWTTTIPGSSLNVAGTVSLGGPVNVTQGTSPWLVSLGTHAVTQASGPWTVTIPGASLNAAITNTVPVSLAALPTGTNTIGDVNLTAAARGGYSPYFANAITGSVAVSAAAGKFGGCVLINLNSAPAYLQVFDQGSGSNVSLGSTAPTFSIPIPANATAANGAAVVVPFEVGLKMNNGIKVAATTTANGGATVSTGLSGTIYYA